MGVSLTGRMESVLTWVQKNTLDSGRIISDPNSLSASLAIPSDANLLWHDQREVTVASGTDDIDLQSLTDVFGNALSFTTVYAFAIWNRGDKNADGTYTTTTGEGIQIGDAASNPWAAPFDGDVDGKLHLGTGGVVQFAEPVDGWAVSGSSKVLRIAHDGSTADIRYDIAIIGK